MPKPPDTTTRRRQPSWRLIGLTALVVMGHWAILRATPLAWAAHASADTGAAWYFSTRTIAAPEAPVTPPTPDPKPAAAKPRAPRVAPPEPAPAAPPTEVLETNAALALEEQAQAATETIATEFAKDATLTHVPVLLAAAGAPNPRAADAPTVKASLPLVTPSAPATLPAAKAVQKFVVPTSARLKYDVKGEVKGFPYHVNGDLQWSQDGKTYNARMEISHFLLGSRVQTSTGQIGAHGLEPIRFSDKVRSEVAAHFNYDTNKVTFSANTPDVPLLPGAQDQLSVLLQVATMVAGDPRQFGQGSTLSFQAVGPRSAENWVFTVGTAEKLSLQGGELTALHLWRAPNGQYDTRLEIWLAPDLGYLPVRIRLTQANGDVADQQWSSTVK